MNLNSNSSISFVATFEGALLELWSSSIFAQGATPQTPQRCCIFQLLAQSWGIIQCNQLCFSDDRCREVCNRPVKIFIDRCSRFAQGDVPHGFHERVEHFKPPPAQFIVSEFRFCHAKCGDDVHCKEQCPMPFWMKFKTTCDEAIPIMECHQTCGHDHECHQKCPLPSCLHMKAHIEETMKCHGQCGDRECHHMCPKPMKKILMKCKAFMECQGCHEKCHDFSCHHECPKARLWKFFGKHGFGYHDDFHHHHDGKFHHHHDGNFHHHHDGNFHHHHDGDFHHHHDGDFHHHHDGDFHHHHDPKFHHHHDGDFNHQHHDGDFHRQHHDGDFHHHHDGDFHHQQHQHHDKDFHHHHDGDFHHHGAQPMIDPIAPVAPAAPALPEPTPTTKKIITCSMKCGWDAGCWDKCQGDWRELRKHCEEMTEIMVCHKKCFHDHMCHQNCPRPEMPWLKEKVEASLGCHHECGDDRKCHHKCKCQFAEMKEKCVSRWWLLMIVKTLKTNLEPHSIYGCSVHDSLFLEVHFRFPLCLRGCNMLYFTFTSFISIDGELVVKFGGLLRWENAFQKTSLLRSG